MKAAVPIVKADDVAYPILQAPELNVQEQFLIDFGMHRVSRTQDSLYMRGEGPQPFVHVSHLGEKKFVGMAFEACTIDDVKNLSQAEGFSPIEEMDSPGGGYRTHGLDPDGNRIELIFGRERRQLDDDLAAQEINVGGVDHANFRRLNRAKRFLKGRTPRIKRFGHIAIHMSDLGASLDWYNRHLGIIATDIVKPPPADEQTPVGGIFSRLDRGDKPSDHHSIFMIATSDLADNKPGLNHVSYEMIDIDDVFMGHEILDKAGYEPEWGIGRHYLGSQIFDYWRSPFGHVHEHQTDGDVFDNSFPPQIVNAGELGDPDDRARGQSQWGPPLNPDTFGDARGL
ncbi:MAG: VOC family protein [Pseudomonadota bacterium]